MLNIPFENTYLRLGEAFYVKTRPTPVAQPKFVTFNVELAEQLRLGGAGLDSPEGLAMFSGNLVPPGAEPVAMAYAGHQFGHFNQQLGDGRALLLGEIVAPDGMRHDIQLKGSGPTAFSRRGDGRSALGPVLREYLVSEAMAALGVPTTRALAAVTTGEKVVRMNPLPGAILTRIATSYVRVGTFQYFAFRNDKRAVQKLADYVIRRNFPEVLDAEHNPYIAFLAAVIERQAALIARWMQLGFIHGVMNTDNMSVAGETIDFGPCAFMDGFNPQQVYSSIDRNGRYAYGNQPVIGKWNLARLSETLLPLLAENSVDAIAIAQDLLHIYQEKYEHYWLSGMRKKIGLFVARETDKLLIEKLLSIMDKQQADFSLTFHYLSQLSAGQNGSDNKIRSLFNQSEDFDHWLAEWRVRLTEEVLSDDRRQQKMQAINPVCIPRNHQIEAAIRAAEEQGDFSPFRELHTVLINPYKLQSGKERYMQPPREEEIVHQTFCGT